jgi:hypothetical protein
VLDLGARSKPLHNELDRVGVSAAVAQGAAKSTVEDADSQWLRPPASATPYRTWTAISFIKPRVLRLAVLARRTASGLSWANVSGGRLSERSSAWTALTTEAPIGRRSALRARARNTENNVPV